MARKRSIDEEAEIVDVPSSAKKTRFSKNINYETIGRVCNGEQPSNTASPSSPPSVVSTEAQSAAETAVTSRSSSKRPKKYICDFDGCSKAFDRPVKLQAHVRTHTDDRPFACEEDGCDKRFFKAEHLKAHVQNKHSNEANFVCSYVLSTDTDGEDMQCGKAFTTATRLKRHVAMHEEKEDLTCHEPGCGQIFRKMETLQRHIKKEHLNEDSFRCTKVIYDALTNTSQECGQTFSSASQLQRHKAKEHVGKKYFCPNCVELTSNEPIGFYTYAEYQNHLKSEHPPTCTICYKICDSNRALTAHMEIEHNTLASRQKFVCEHVDENGVLCGRGFTRAGNLKVHVQNVHVMNKKFICGRFDLSSSKKVPDWNGRGCGTSFGTKHNLEEHVRTQHLGLRSVYHPHGSRSRKSKGKPESSSGLDQSSTTPASLMDLDEPPEEDTLDLLTGHGYASNRPLACWISGCSNRFSRKFDLAQHMELKHGWNVDDINDRLAEDAALDGDRFWIGGDDAEDEDCVEDDDEGLKMERLSLSQEGSLGVSSWDDMYGVFEGCSGPPVFGGERDYDMAIDPMLVEF